MDAVTTQKIRITIITETIDAIGVLGFADVSDLTDAADVTSATETIDATGVLGFADVLGLTDAADVTSVKGTTDSTAQTGVINVTSAIFLTSVHYVVFVIPAANVLFAQLAPLVR